MSSFPLPNELIALILEALVVPSLLRCMQVITMYQPSPTVVSYLTFILGLQAVSIHYTRKLYFVVQSVFIRSADDRRQAL